MTSSSSSRSVAVGALPGAEFLRFAEEHSFDPVDGTRIKSQYSAALLSAAPESGAIGLRGCGDLVAAASYGIVGLPQPNAVSARIDVVVTPPHCRGRGLARAAVGTLLLRFIDQFADRLRHVSVVAAHPTIGRIVEALGFTDAKIGTKSPVLHRTIDDHTRVALRVDAEQLQSTTLRNLRTECARCMWKRAAPWCGRKGPVDGP